MAYIMIIDDDEDFSSATAMVLKNAGHEVAEEYAPGPALKAIEQRQPDLLILDVMFPEDSSAGFKLARDRALHGVPILMLTAVNSKFPLGFSPKDIDDTWLPVKGFLEKPLDFEVLTKKVADVLAESNATA